MSVFYRWHCRLLDGYKHSIGIPSYLNEREARSGLLVALGYIGFASPIRTLSALSEDLGTRAHLDRRYTLGKQKAGIRLARKWLIEEMEAAR